VVDVVAFRVDAQRGERVVLRGEVVIDGRDPGVADLEFAPRPSVTVSLPSPGRFSPDQSYGTARASLRCGIRSSVCRRRFGYRAGVQSSAGIRDHELFRVAPD